MGLLTEMPVDGDGEAARGCKVGRRGRVAGWGGDRWPVQLLTALGGLVSMLMLAGGLDWNQQLGQRVAATPVIGQGAA